MDGFEVNILTCMRYVLENECMNDFPTSPEVDRNTEWNFCIATFLILIPSRLKCSRTSGDWRP